MTTKLKGPGVKRKEAYSIMYKARKAAPGALCPYTRNTHKWSIWTTARRYMKSHTHDQIYAALEAAGVKCNE